MPALDSPISLHGEPTPSHWPTINSHFGVKDIAGFDKDDTSYCE